ncbi:MAG: regulatory protein RecX [Gammaproteobacteria bacterium]
MHGSESELSFTAESEPTPRRSSPRKIALDILALREHSVQELRDKLRLREFADDEIAATLEALVREGLLSEERFIESFVGSHARRGHGPVWIRAELERRGIAGQVIREALDRADVDWDAAAEAVRVKRFGPGIPADFGERARQARFLQYRGFRTKILDP